MKTRLTMILSVLIFGLAGCAVGSRSIVSQGATSSDINNIDTSDPPSLLALNFLSHGDRLNGILYQANGAGPHPTIVLLHGYPGSERNLDLAQDLRQAGYNVLFFHYRGAWGSGGTFSFSKVVEDVASALSYLRESADDLRVDSERIMLIGHSVGGFAALQGAARDAAVTCVAAIASADIGKLADIFAADPKIAKSFSEYTDSLAMLKGWTGAQMLASVQQHRDEFSLIELAPKLAGKSVLLVAGEQDSDVEPERFHTPMVAAYAAQPDIELTHVVMSGDHSFSWSRTELIQTVLDWTINCVDAE